MENPIIFIIIDSVRSFKTGLDDRDKLEAMEKFAENSIEFQNAFCSAPSSIMSAASMFTGIPSAFIARNYNDWQFNEGSSIISLQSILTKQGYKIYSIDNSKESREMNQALILPLRKKYLPKGFSHGDYWTNKDLCKILNNLFIAHSPPKKSFFMLWFDCREDPLTSHYVDECINIFKKNNFYDDSIIFLTSDHGYPTPKSGLNKETMKGRGHDMIVTEDNIQIPFYLKYPGAVPKKIKTLISNIDCTPTVLDLLNINSNILSKFSEGKSLLKTINEEVEGRSENRIIRIDTRLLSQDNRVVALRSNNHKFIHYVDQNKFELFDIVNDKNEIHPLNHKDHTETIKNFSKVLKEYEKKINEHHKNQINKNINKIKKRIESSKKIFINNKLPKELLKIITKIIKEINPKLKIYYPKVYNVSIPTLELFIQNDIENYNFDYVFSIKEKTYFSFASNNFLKDKKVKYKKILYFDYDMKEYNRIISKWLWPMWKYRLNRNFYLDEPGLLLIDMIRLAKSFLNKYFHKKEDKFDVLQAKQIRDRVIKNENKR